MNLKTCAEGRMSHIRGTGPDLLCANIQSCFESRRLHCVPQRWSTESCVKMGHLWKEEVQGNTALTKEKLVLRCQMQFIEISGLTSQTRNGWPTWWSSQFQSEKIYLSPIIDCYDSMQAVWNISSKPDTQLVNTMLDRTTRSLLQDAHPIIHSNRGYHYRWPGWSKRVDDAGLIRSMSRKGCLPDNSACEGLFWMMKNEMFYGRS